jgi:hypothetical protein
MLCSCCCPPKAPNALREPLCSEKELEDKKTDTTIIVSLQNEMKDIKQQVRSIQLTTEQNTSALCSLREMLDVFANLFITEVDSQIDRKIKERLGASSSSDSE